ncbi:MAG TPA: hypothetical protein PKB13_10390 [Clostridia bacterium]|nr:hypothetical protein [Clostridia bacterium]
MKSPKLWDFFCHASIVLGSMFVVFFFLDRVNPAMEFISSDISKGLLLTFCLCAITNGIIGATYLFKREKAQKTHHERKKESDGYERHYE